jgi:hypothetical protein
VEYLLFVGLLKYREHFTYYPATFTPTKKFKEGKGVPRVLIKNCPSHQDLTVGLS